MRISILLAPIFCVLSGSWVVANESVFRPSNVETLAGRPFPPSQYVKMSDGVALRTIIYDLPTRTSGKGVPVVLIRTPYFYDYLGQPKAPGYDKMAQYFHSQGYAFVIQAIRGTGLSEGEYALLNNKEIDDGYDTVNWLTQQSFCNGRVALYGVSADGHTALAGGIRRPLGLKVILAGGAPGDNYEDGFITNGQPDLYLIDYIHRFSTQKDIIASPIDPSKQMSVLQLISSKLLNEPDPRKYDLYAFGAKDSEWQKLSAAIPDRTSTYWKNSSIRERIKEIAVPTYHIGGLMGDGDMWDTVRNFQSGYSGSSSVLHYLILGYWGHSQSLPYFSGVSKYSNLGVDSMVRSILAYYLKDEELPNGTRPKNHVLISSNFDAAQRNSDGTYDFKDVKQDFLESNSYPIETNVQHLDLRLILDPSGKRKLTADLSDTVLPRTDIYLSHPATFDDPIVPKESVIYTYEFTEKTRLWGPMELTLFLKTDSALSDVFADLRHVDLNGKERYLLDTRLVETRNSFTQSLAFKVKASMFLQAYSRISPPYMEEFEKGEKLKLIIRSSVYPNRVRCTNNEPTLPIDAYFSKFTDVNVEVGIGGLYSSRLMIRTLK